LEAKDFAQAEEVQTIVNDLKDARANGELPGGIHGVVSDIVDDDPLLSPIGMCARVSFFRGYGSWPRRLRVEARLAHLSEQYLLLLCDPTRK
jgi:hypothetical protein